MSLFVTFVPYRTSRALSHRACVGWKRPLPNPEDPLRRQRAQDTRELVLGRLGVKQALPFPPLEMLAPRRRAVATGQQRYQPILASHGSVERRPRFQRIRFDVELPVPPPVTNLQLRIGRQRRMTPHEKGTKHGILAIRLPIEHPALVLRSASRCAHDSRCDS